MPRIRAWNSTLYQNTEKQLKRSPVKRVSDKQKIKNREWAKVKKALLKAQEAENFSYASCPKCGYSIPIERASVLEAHHKVFRSHQGPNTEANAALLCPKCHRGPGGIHAC